MKGQYYDDGTPPITHCEGCFLSATEISSETLHVPAMDCPDELSLIRKGLARLEGIESLRPDYLHRRLRVEFDPRRTTAEQIAARITEIGFPATVSSGGSSDVEAPPKTNWTRHALTAVGGTLLGAAAVVYWAGGETTTLAAALAVLSTCLSALPVSLAAWRAVRLRAIDMNVLMLIAALGATATADYFEAATAMFLFGIAIWLESFSVGRARRAVQSLVELTPEMAHRLKDNAASDDYVDVAAGSIAAGECVLIKPGERVPVDGVVLRGTSALNQAPITGESLPVEKSPGESVFAGSLNEEGSLVVRAERPAAESTLAHIARLVEQAQASGSPTERFVDRFARYYTPAVLALAVAMALGPPLLVLTGALGDDSSRWWPEFLTWFRRSLVMLVIACPCALVISTPVTIVCGLYAAARRGMIIKGGQFLEAAALVDCVAIDKTGTLTEGRPQVIAVTPCEGYSPDEVLLIAAALESHSEHPLANAITEAAEARGIAIETTTDFSALRGFGVQGMVAGTMCQVGSPRMFQQQGLLAADDIEALTADHSTATVALVARGGEPIGAVFLADALRDGAADAISSLRDAGVRRVVMLTGDRQSVADEIAQQAGIDEVRAELLPEDKVDEVRRLSRTYVNLAMVGDGVNDSPALAAAPLGIALGRQASATVLETADVVVMLPVLGRLAELIRLGRHCRRLLAQNITLALSIKLAVLVAAAAGEATLWMAVAADVGASVLVIFNGMRILDFKSQIRNPKSEI